MKFVMGFLLSLAVSFVSLLLFSTPAFAADAATSAGIDGYSAIAAGLCIGIAALAGAFSQGKAVCSALDGIARNPGASGQMFVPMILGLVLIESLVIYALVISMKLVGIF